MQRYKEWYKPIPGLSALPGDLSRVISFLTSLGIITLVHPELLGPEQQQCQCNHANGQQPEQSGAIAVALIDENLLIRMDHIEIDTAWGNTRLTRTQPDHPQHER